MSHRKKRFEGSGSIPTKEMMPLGYAYHAEMDSGEEGFYVSKEKTEYYDFPIYAWFQLPKQAEDTNGNKIVIEKDKWFDK